MLAKLKCGFTSADDSNLKDGNVTYPLIMRLNYALEPMLRCDAEVDPSMKQVIPYVVLEHDGKIFCTHRLKGDARLEGSYSIGTGGHIDGGESIYQAMYRELAEEVGVKHEDIFGYHISGYINDNTSEVNKVHLGIVVRMVLKHPNISCKETEKLSGEWISFSDLERLDKKNFLESWSSIVLQECF